jgi:16S rRNA (guanine527-N7)-methyltransferase
MPVPAWFSETLAREIKPWATLTVDQIGQLYQHFELLEHWNKRMNLTAIESGPEMVIRHYCEALFFGLHLPGDLHSIADMGSGAGFPGIPMAVLRENWGITLIESNQRKAVFLREASRTLGNVVVLSSRAEDLAEKFDCLVSRAVAAGDVLALIPRLAPRIGLMVGEDDIPALQAAKHVAWAEPVRLPWGDRRICMFGEYVSRGT